MDHLIEYGIWSDQAGGMIESGLYGPDAEIALTRWLSEGETDVELIPVCQHHDEQPANHCELCEENESEDD
jgi:hypothetical protein